MQTKGITKRLLIWALLLCPLGWLHGQVTLQPLPVPNGVVAKPMLWNCVVVNSGASGLQAKLHLVLSDRSTNQVLLNGVSTLLNLPVGATNLQFATASPVQYSGTSAALLAADFLHAGNYQVCYFLIPVQENPQPLAQDCRIFDVTPLLPPQLIYPADSSQMNHGPTQLSWLPPAPPFLFQNLQYQVLLTEVLPGQTGLDAVQMNTPLITQSYLANNFLPVAAAQSLWQPGKQYAWQVVAMDMGQYVAKSETWTFKLDSVLAPADSSESEPFVVLQREEVPQPIVSVKERRLSVQFQSYSDDHVGQFVITKGGEVVKTMQQWIRSGNNQYELPLGNWCETGVVYKLLIRDKGNSRFTALFKRQP